MEIFRSVGPGTAVSPIAAVVMLCCVWLCSAGAPTNAQGYSKMDDPNLKHFYMGRQEIEVIDNTPIVKYRNGSSAEQPGIAGPQGPQPLPSAGFQQYSSNVHGGPLNLPKVENGVPHKAPTSNALKGNATKLKAKSLKQGNTSRPSQPAPTAIKSYGQIYKTRPQPSTSTESQPGSTQKVRGKLLPFATTRKRSND